MLVTNVVVSHRHHYDVTDDDNGARMLGVPLLATRYSRVAPLIGQLMLTFTSSYQLSIILLSFQLFHHHHDIMYGVLNTALKNELIRLE